MVRVSLVTPPMLSRCRSSEGCCQGQRRVGLFAPPGGLRSPKVLANVPDRCCGSSFLRTLIHYSVTRCSSVDQRRALSGTLRLLDGELLLLASVLCP